MRKLHSNRVMVIANLREISNIHFDNFPLFRWKGGWGYLFAVQLKFPEQVASLLSVKCQRIVVQILYFRYPLQIQTINLEQSLK